MSKVRWTRPVTVVALGLALGLVLAACGEQSRVDPDADVRVSGVVRQPNGDQPLGDRPVQLGTGVSEGEIGLAMLTFGVSCTTGNCSGDRFDAATAADGGFEFNLKGKDTQSSFGEAASVLVSTSAAPGEGQVSGATVGARFKIQDVDIRLPDLRLVDPGLTLASDTDVNATWSATAPGPYTLTFETADPIPAWQVVAATSPVAVDPRLLEDTSGRAVIAAAATDEIVGSDVEIQWRSPGVGFAAGAGAPPSRGRPCTFTNAAGAAGAPETSCALTDGDLADAALSPPVCPAGSTMPTTACTPATAAVVTLGRPVPAELVVVRGCTGGCAVETSADGTTFAPVGSASDGFGQVALDGRPITAVRVGLGSEGELREVSVWGPRPAKPALATPAEDAALRDTFGGERATDDGLPRWLIGGAAALAAAALFAVAYTLGRRRAVAGERAST